MKKKLMIIGPVVLLVALFAVKTFVLAPPPPDEKKLAKEAGLTYTMKDPFVVNLADGGGTPHFAKVGVALRVLEAVRGRDHPRRGRHARPRRGGVGAARHRHLHPPEQDQRPARQRRRPRGRGEEEDRRAGQQGDRLQDRGRLLHGVRRPVGQTTRGRPRGAVSARWPWPGHLRPAAPPRRARAASDPPLGSGPDVGVGRELDAHLGAALAAEDLHEVGELAGDPEAAPAGAERGGGWVAQTRPGSNRADVARPRRRRGRRPRRRRGSAACRAPGRWRSPRRARAPGRRRGPRSRCARRSRAWPTRTSAISAGSGPSAA